MCLVNRVCKKKLPEQLGLHCYAVTTHPDELVLETPHKKSWILLCQGIGSQSAPYEAPGLRERNLGAPRAIRLFIKILTWLILQLSKEAIMALTKFANGSVEMWQHGGN